MDPKIKADEDDNIGETPGDPGFGTDSLDTMTKAQSVKEKIGKLDFIKIKNFCCPNDTIIIF